jgi:hypothetical protein
MPEIRRLTPSEISAISLEVREDYQAAAEEVRQLGLRLDEQSRAKGRAAAERLPAPPPVPRVRQVPR